MILDRDVFGTGDYGEYGVSLSGGRIAFGVGRGGRQQTICGLIDVADGRWHHVALTRRVADGVMRIYVDGTESAQGIGPAGDISYRDGRPTGVSSDPFLVVGASKADDGAGGHGFSGALDELRLSSSIRYSSPFDRPIAPFTADAETALLFHFDEGPAGPCLSSVVDTSGRATHGQCRHGGSTTPGPLYEADAPFLPPRQKTWLLGSGRPAHRARAVRRPGLADAGAGRRRHARLTLRAAADTEHPLSERLRSRRSTPESSFTPESSSALRQQRRRRGVRAGAPELRVRVPVERPLDDDRHRAGDDRAEALFVQLGHRGARPDRRRSGASWPAP